MFCSLFEVVLTKNKLRYDIPSTMIDDKQFKGDCPKRLSILKL